MTLMHRIFQKLGKTPDEVMAKPFFVRCFIFASMMVEIESEERRAQEAAQRAQAARQKPRSAPKRRR